MSRAPAHRRDLNGKPVPTSRWTRWRDRLAGSASEAELGVDEPGLEIVAESADEAQASSAALASSAWRPEDEVVLRHILEVPDEQVADVTAIAAMDGYLAVDRAPEGGDAQSGQPSASTLIALARVQLIDAMHLSQERSRMASLASRSAGRVVGWQVLQRPPPR